MDLTKLNPMKLKHIVEIYRPMSLISSLPFVVEGNEEQKVRWFVYSLNQNSKINELIVQRICTLDQTGRVRIELTPNLKFQLSIIDELEDTLEIDEEFDENEYYEQFVLAFNTNDHEKMNELLRKSESRSSLSVYNAIKKYNSTD